jgi:hypothetical protein
MATEQEQEFQRLLEAMKKAGGVLNEAGVPFVLGGGLACWAEQVDWDEVRERTKDSPFATAYFTLLAELEIVLT